MHRESHGRIYVRGLPPEWTWWECHHWVTKELCLPAPSWIKMHERKPGADVVSCYLHFHKPTQGQLDTFVEHLTGKWLTHRKTEAMVAQDEFHPKAKENRSAPYGQATWLKVEKKIGVRSTMKKPWWEHVGSCKGRQLTMGWYHSVNRDTGEAGTCPCCNHPVYPECPACRASCLEPLAWGFVLWTKTKVMYL